MAYNKIGFDYFSLDTDRYMDKRIVRLKNEHGCVGISVYDYILCEIYRVEGFYTDFDDDFVVIISDYFRLKEETVNEVIMYCGTIGLFDQKLLLNKKIITSFAIQKRFLDWTKKSRRVGVEIPKSLKSHRKNLNISEESAHSSEESAHSSEESAHSSEESAHSSGFLRQSKVKESKVKESKEKGACADEQVRTDQFSVQNQNEKNQENSDAENPKNQNEKIEKMIVQKMLKIWLEKFPDYLYFEKTDKTALLEIAYLIAEMKKIPKHEVVGSREDEIFGVWEKIVHFLKNQTQNSFFKKLTIHGISIPKNLQSVLTEMSAPKIENQTPKNPNQEKSGYDSGASDENYFKDMITRRRVRE